jgi:hypothetical protein
MRPSSIVIAIGKRIWLFGCQNRWLFTVLSKHQKDLVGFRFLPESIESDFLSRAASTAAISDHQRRI